LRWFTPAGQLIPLPEEAERQAREQAQQAEALERQAKEQAQRRAEQLEALLRAQGIDPDQPLGL